MLKRIVNDFKECRANNNNVPCGNGMTGFCPVPRPAIEVQRKGQIRDWPKKASYQQGTNYVQMHGTTP